MVVKNTAEQASKSSYRYCNTIQCHWLLIAAATAIGNNYAQGCKEISKIHRLKTKTLIRGIFPLFSNSKV